MPTLELSIIIVSYNTRELTLDCLRSIYEQTLDVHFEILLVDNNSTDGSARAIASHFPNVKLFAEKKNHGFAGGNNLAAAHAKGQHLLLINPDTVVLDRAIERLLSFANRENDAQIWGGKTVFADGKLNRTNCWGKPSLRSMLTKAMGLSALGRNTVFADPETYPTWNRDSEREVDIVSGAFLMIERRFWEQLGGFDSAFFMYGEEADLCLRAHKLGARPRITPDACIIHLVGASQPQSNRLIQLLRGRQRLIHRHWERFHRAGSLLHQAWIVRRMLAWRVLAMIHVNGAAERSAMLSEVWRKRAEWAHIETVIST